MSLADISRELGFHHNTLSVMKHSRKDLWDYIHTYDDDTLVAFRKYKADQEELMKDMEWIFYELADNRQLLEFSKLLAKKGLYKHPNNYSSCASRMVFRVRERYLTFGTFTKFKQIVRIYNEGKWLPE